MTTRQLKGTTSIQESIVVPPGVRQVIVGLRQNKHGISYDREELSKAGGGIRLARDPRGYGGRDRAGSIDLAISHAMVPWMGRVLFYYFPYGPASLFLPFLKSMFREKE